MVSIAFLYLFLPVFVGIYAAFPSRHRGKLILFVSVGMVLLSDPIGLVPLIVSVLTGYIGGILIYNFRTDKVKQKILLAAVSVVNAAAYIIFAVLARESGSLFGENRFIGFAAFGAAVYTLHSISYCVDIYRGQFRCENSFFVTAEYITFFPVMTAGPLLRFDNMRDSLKNPVIAGDKMALGIRLYLVGLVEKLILSNGMFEIWENVRAMDITKLSFFSAWIGIVIFLFSFYFEMSAYANISRGLASILGFDIPVNFDFPLTAHSFSDMFSKFNVTVSGWCKDYIIKSITGEKDSFILKSLAVIAASAAALTWYGCTTGKLIFALYISLLIILEISLNNVMSKAPAVLKQVVMIALLLIGLPLFAFDNATDALGYLGAMFGINNAPLDVLSVYLIRTSLILFAVCTFLVSGIYKFIVQKFRTMNEYLLTIIQPIGVIALLLLSTAFLISGNSELFVRLF